MTYDEAFDLNRIDEVVEAADIEPENVWTPEDLDEQTDREEAERYYRSLPETPEQISAFEAYLDRLNEKTQEDHS
jgi:hypothetical protein